jgi:hypothetical protein
MSDPKLRLPLPARYRSGRNQLNIAISDELDAELEAEAEALGTSKAHVGRLRLAGKTVKVTDNAA